MRLDSQVIVTANFDETIAQLRALATSDERLEIIRPDEGKTFTLKDAQRAIDKATMASYERLIIVLLAEQFSEVVQNKLLKAIEEPPANTEFVLMVSNRATLLATVRSRLPITVLGEVHERQVLDLNMARLDVRSVYAFVQQHKRTDAAQVKTLLEQIAHAAIQSGHYHLDTQALDHLRDSRRALDKGAPGTFVLIGVLLKLLARKEKT